MTAGAGELASVFSAAFVRLRNSGCIRVRSLRRGVGGGLVEGRSANTKGLNRVYMKPCTKATDIVSAGMP